MRNQPADGSLFLLLLLLVPLLACIAVGSLAQAPQANLPLSAPNPDVSCNTWNLASDFRLYPDQENPSRDACGEDAAWHYMQSATLIRDPAAYSLLTDFAPDGEGTFGIEVWRGTFSTEPYSDIKQPTVGINATGAPFSPSSGVFSWPPNKMLLHLR